MSKAIPAIYMKEVKAELNRSTLCPPCVRRSGIISRALMFGDDVHAASVRADGALTMAMIVTIKMMVMMCEKVLISFSTAPREKSKDNITGRG